MRRTVDGDTTLAEWSADDRESVARAQALLREKTGQGYMAVLDEPGSNEPVSEIPPGAGLVVLTTPMGGG